MGIEKSQTVIRQEVTFVFPKMVLGSLYSSVFIFLGVVISLYASEISIYLRIPTGSIEKIFLLSIFFYVIATLPIMFSLPKKQAAYCLVFLMGYLLGNYPVIIEDLVTKKVDYLQNEIKKTERNREA